MTDATFVTLETATCEIGAVHREDGDVGIYIQPRRCSDLQIGMKMSREAAAGFANAILDELEACDAAEPEPEDACVFVFRDDPGYGFSAAHTEDGRVALSIINDGLVPTFAFMSRAELLDIAYEIADELEDFGDAPGTATAAEPGYDTTLGPDGSFILTTPDRVYAIDGATLAEFVDDVIGDEADALEDAGFDDEAFERALVDDLSASLDLNKREREHFRSLVAASLDRVSCGEAGH